MKDRVQQYYKNDDLFIGNIHSFCENFIKEKQIVPANISILDEEDTNILINKDNRNSWTRVFYNYINNIRTLKEARQIVNNFFESGINPLDLIIYNKNFLIETFYDCFEKNRIVIFDTETTGTDTNNDDIIQIAAIEVIYGKIDKTFEVYIKTDKSLEETEFVHHITKEFLEENGLSRKEALKKFKEFVNDAILIAHNADFDINMSSAIQKYTI